MTKTKSKNLSLREQVALNIRTIRLGLGLSPETLASKAKISARYVYSIESGARNLSIDSIESIADALGCDVCDLMCRPEHPVQNRKEALELAINLLKDELKNSSNK